MLLEIAKVETGDIPRNPDVKRFFRSRKINMQWYEAIEGGRYGGAFLRTLHFNGVLGLHSTLHVEKTLTAADNASESRRSQGGKETLPETRSICKQHRRFSSTQQTI